jgi:uncharacterized protein GlcG (DUF336 family)
LHRASSCGIERRPIYRGDARFETGIAPAYDGCGSLLGSRAFAIGIHTASPEDGMKAYHLTAAALLAGLAMPAHAELLAHKDLSMETALEIATTAIATCKTQGYRVSATVVGRTGEIIVQLRGDNTGPHTVENSFRKAYTARTFRVPSGEIAQRVKDNPTLGLIHLTNVIANQGALPIKVGDDVIGAAGASGAPGGEKDEACVKAGIDKVADQLK